MVRREKVARQVKAGNFDVNPYEVMVRLGIK